MDTSDAKDRGRTDPPLESSSRLADPPGEAGGRGIRIALRVLLVLGLLYLFLIAIQLMGTSFKLLGKDFAQQLVSATSSPFAGLFIGILATAIIQSSSVTTSLVVGLVSVEGVTALPISAAVPIIMGANIGTSVTNALVSLGHMGRRDEFRRAFSGAVIHDTFNWLTVALLFPLELTTGVLHKSAAFLATHLYGSASLSYHSPIKAAVKPVAHALKGIATHDFGLSNVPAGALLIIVAFALIFLSLTGLVQILRALMSDRLEGLVHRALSKGPLVTMGIGLVVTASVQSSSITTSILVPLVATGLIQLEHAFPITLGANVGTTVTALLAALAGNVHGLTIAIVHTLFNIIGIAVIYPLRPIRRIPLAFAEWLGRVAAERRIIALVFIVGMFFILPLVVILLDRVFA